MDRDELIRPKDAMRLLQVTNQTLINWEQRGLLTSIRTKGGQRRYRKADLIARISSDSTTANSSSVSPTDNSTKRVKVAYCRVSSPSQRQDLERQIEFFRTAYPNHLIVSDIGSGINFKRKGFNSLLDQAIRGDIEEIMVTHRDRLCRFGFDFFERIVQQYSKGQVVVLDKGETSPEKELLDDLLSIITVFSSRLYGLRSHKLKNQIKEKAICQVRKSTKRHQPKERAIQEISNKLQKL
jgi:putative resolvase